MHPAGPILDYASPRNRVKLRLPASSHVDLACEPDEVKVIETLKGHGQAEVAISFAVFMLIYLIAYMWNVHSSIPVFLPFWLIEAGVMLLVIHQTWRKTLLVVNKEFVRLQFYSPLHHKEYEWPAVDVLHVLTPQTGVTKFLPLVELQIHLASGGEVHLFTDHPRREIDPIAAAIHAMLGIAEVRAVLPIVENFEERGDS